MWASPCRGSRTFACLASTHPQVCQHFRLCLSTGHLYWHLCFRMSMILIPFTSLSAKERKAQVQQLADVATLRNYEKQVAAVIKPHHDMNISAEKGGTRSGCLSLL